MASASLKLSRSSSALSSTLIPFDIWSTSTRRLPVTASIVCAERLIESFMSKSSSEPSTRAERISSPVSGPNRISFSCGYCDSQLRSAPRSTMPCSISKIMPTDDWAVSPA